jgi:hypothetical protein
VITLTTFTKAGGPLTKRISIDGQGRLISDGSAIIMALGEASRDRLADVGAFADHIGRLGNNQAIALGALRAGLPDRVRITTKSKLNGATAPDTIARTGADIVYAKGCPALALIDFDTKGLPDDVARRIAKAGGVWPALVAVLPHLRDIARVSRASTSAGLYRGDTGERLPGSDGAHLYLAIRDGSDADRFLRTLHERCWLAGLGWYMVGAGGQLLDRSIVDRMVGAPERLVFEAAPILAPPLEQNAQSRRPVACDGDVLDTLAACPPLAAGEKAWLAEARSKAAYRLEGDRARAREEFIGRQTDILAERHGITHHTAREIVISQCNGILLPAIALPFDDADLAGKTVADVLADPAGFEGETLADPFEGPEYGRCKARIMRRADGTPWINSFAHGRTVYELKLDAAAVLAILDKTPDREVIDTMIRLVLAAKLNDVEIETLVAWAHKKTGSGIRAITRILKQARTAAAAAQKKQDTERRAAQRTDPRPTLPAPEPDAPWLPEMDAYNAVLGKNQDRLPPARNIENQAAYAQEKKLPGIHAFLSSNENVAATAPSITVEGRQPPAQWIIAPMSECEAAEMLERHIDFVDIEGRSVHCPTPFVRHYMKRNDGALPTIAAITTLPVVLADGHILVADGLERARGIVFIVEQKLMKLVPERTSCTTTAVGEAMRFLCDEWLVDVATDQKGKAVLVTLAITIIERSLLDQRPAYFVTAGKRGNGKTTTLKMILEAVTGTPATASAWSPNEEERRKALLAYFLYGVPYILWDNIARGTQISCPHIEKSCTSAYYADRKLGVSEMVATAAATIHVFTGNNVAPKGDLASRSLQVRLDADRIDPENRKFKHPDPLAWTSAHRNKILQALYTILLGNPTLNLAHDAPMKTRYKMWQRIIGSAVEHAAKCALESNPDIDTMPDKPDLPDFGTLFLDQEADEEDAESLADLLDALDRAYPYGFKAADIAERINTRPESAAAITARSFLFPTLAPGSPVSSKTVGKRLGAHVGEPVKHGARTLVLRFDRDTHGKVNKFYVKDITPEGQ